MLAVSRRAWASRSPASARASCRCGRPLGGGLGEFLRLGARLGDVLLGQLAGGQHRVEGAYRIARQARLHVDPHHLDAQPAAGRGQRRQAVVDALHQVAAQAFAALGDRAVVAEQLRARHQDGVQVARGADLHGVARHQPVQRRQHVGALEDVGVRVVDLVEHPHVQLHHPGVAGQQVAGAGQRVAGQADVEIGATRLLGTQQALDAAFDHLFGGRQQHHLLQRLRPGQQQAGTGQALQRAQAQHYGAVLRADLADVGKRPGQRRQEGHAEQCEERQASGLQPGAAQPSRASPLMAGARWPALRRGTPAARRPARGTVRHRCARPAGYRR